MINANFGKVQLKGRESLLLADLSTIVSGLKETGIEVDKILEAVEMGLMSEEEVRKHIEKKLLKAIFNYEE